MTALTMNKTSSLDKEVVAKYGINSFSRKMSIFDLSIIESTSFRVDFGHIHGPKDGYSQPKSTFILYHEEDKKSILLTNNQ